MLPKKETKETIKIACNGAVKVIKEIRNLVESVTGYKIITRDFVYIAIIIAALAIIFGNYKLTYTSHYHEETTTRTSH